MKPILKKSFLLACLIFASDAFAQSSLEELTQTDLGRTLGVALASPDLVKKFYEQNQYQPVWGSGIKDYLAAVAALERDGLNPADYHHDVIKTKLDADAAQLDVLLTDSCLTLIRHLVAGRVDPKKVQGDWFYTPQVGDVLALFGEFRLSGSPEKFFARLLPNDPEYLKMREALKYYQDLAAKGGWPKVTVVGKKWEPGERGAHIVSLRNRLLVTGELDKKSVSDPELYDDDLVAAVKKFQQANGLNDDGVVGTYTFEALNRNAEDRIRQIKVNMERWRWLPRTFAKKYIFVNIPDYRVRVVEDSRTKLALKGIVGQPRWRTPVFADEMEFIVLNPRWHVPPRIAQKEVLPSVKNDPSYISKKRFKVFRNEDGQKVLVDPETVDWSQAASGDYLFSQDSGGGNSLGTIKFLFPNSHSIYLHDTPTKGLFKNDVRAYSHGCIRIQNPLELATYLLGGNDGTWDEDKIKKQIGTGREQTLVLKEKLPVYLYYLTAWANDDGSMNFRKDIYDYDARLAKALRL